MNRIKFFFQGLKTWFTHTSMTKRLAALLCVALILFFGYRTIGAKKQQVQYQTAQVMRGDIISTLTESGNVASSTQASVTSPTSGIITDIYVQNGESVTAGQNLFAVKSIATPQEQEQAYANYLSTQNALNTAKAKMNSLQSALFKANQAFVKDAGTQNPDTADPKYIEERGDWQQAESDYNNQSGVISQAEAALSAAGLAYQATQNAVVTAPIDGTVANLSAVIGSGVSSSGLPSTSSGSNPSLSTSLSSSSNSSSAVMVIGNFSNLSIKAAVSEVDVVKVHAGQKATVTLDAFPDKTFVGTVGSVDTIGTNSSGVVTYSAYLTLLSPPSDVMPGMTASAVIQIDRHDNVLSVPSAAVQTSNGLSSVRVLKNGKLTQVPVEIGLTSDTDTEITSGLTEGQTVITSVNIPAAATGGSIGASPFSGTNRGFGGGFGGAAGGRAGSTGARTGGTTGR